jgi:hypothetical protein
MKGFLNVIKKAFLWSYPRNTWQWDVLCVVILIFIFLTPKSWFANSERDRRSGHQSLTVSTVIVGAELIDNYRDSEEVQRRVRTLSGKPTAEVVGVRPRQDSQGKTVAYEVDIR